MPASKRQAAPPTEAQRVIAWRISLLRDAGARRPWLTRSRGIADMTLHGAARTDRSRMLGRAGGRDPGPARGTRSVEEHRRPSRALGAPTRPRVASVSTKTASGGSTRLRALGGERVGRARRAARAAAQGSEVRGRAAACRRPASAGGDQEDLAQQSARRRARSRSSASSTDFEATAASPPGVQVRAYEAAAHVRQARLAGPRDPADRRASPLVADDAAGSPRSGARAGAVRRAAGCDRQRAELAPARRCCSPSPSTTSRSTCSPTASTPPAARSTRRSTTPPEAASGAAAAASRSTSHGPAHEPAGADLRRSDPDAAAGADRPRAHLRAVLRRAGPLRRAGAGGPDADEAVPGMSAHLVGARRAPRTTTAWPGSWSHSDLGLSGGPSRRPAGSAETAPPGCPWVLDQDLAAHAVDDLVAERLPAPRSGSTAASMSSTSSAKRFHHRLRDRAVGIACRRRARRLERSAPAADRRAGASRTRSGVHHLLEPRLPQ